MAGYLKAYVENLGLIGLSLEHAWKISRIISSLMKYLGMKDSPRKRRIESGDWVGFIFNTTDLKITKTVTQSKCQKGRYYIIAINKELSKEPYIQFNCKIIEILRGVMCHLAMVYTIFLPFLKGYNLILARHRGNRDE